MPHIHEKIDYAADAYIVHGDAVLLRFHEKYHTWFPSGGHVELDEDPEEAALREVKEEVGLSVTLVGERAPTYDDGEKEVLVPRFINRHAINEVHEHISFVYFARSESRDVVQGETEVSSHIRWFTREELADPEYRVLERVQYYARMALDALA
ncbi:NUDIX domain-containing protein [Patescibacteria group bacterium]|nr:NUDIX domain-containing protein [Patescibacteria group bacterium]MBU1500699.1 NUDIX domain-containing protein [Patescibacteria group bacterium]MBU2080983.1 NUDIX domain-containing protein [Patescibacteria group bacterium]MBU2124251.1 NUDIX domain-containing protein [Patescibacteria group bacterium]MBU2195044.1 NUDIX domain-containing protein [Patescibacteria group bacterium]